MIVVTQMDGTKVALNVDRLERLEHNAIAHDDGSNVVFVGGGHLVVQESPEILVELVFEAKARVQARAALLALASEQTPAESRRAEQIRGAAGTPQLRMVSDPDTSS